MSIATKLAELTQIRTDIRTALAGKGISASDHDFADFSQDIDSIPSGNNEQIINYSSYTAYSFVNENDTYKINGKFIQLYRSGTQIYLNTSGMASFRAIMRFRLTSNIATNYWGTMFGNSNVNLPITYIRRSGSNNEIICSCKDSGNTATTNILTIPSINTWYYLAFSFDTTLDKLNSYLYDDTGTLVTTETKSFSSVASGNSELRISTYNNNNDTTLNNIDIDIEKVAFERNGSLIWGNITTLMQNMGVIT
ncbi:MAG: hypothetical protein J6S85_02510 [Methanobrevibacter sp.]|nr:hypothetical protein [Methanobrevibacter sp.]